MAHAAGDRMSGAAGRGPVATHTDRFVENAELDDHRAGLGDAVVVLSVSDSRKERLAEDFRRLLGRVFDDLQRVSGLEALTSTREGTALGRRHTRITGDGNYFHFQNPLLSLGSGVAVRLERTRGSELAEPVADHVFSNEDRHVLSTVVDREGKTDEIGQYHRATAPRFDRLLLAASLHLLDLAEEAFLDIRPLLERTCHVLFPPLDNNLIGRLALSTGLAALSELTPR